MNLEVLLISKQKLSLSNPLVTYRPRCKIHITVLHYTIITRIFAPHVSKRECDLFKLVLTTAYIVPVYHVLNDFSSSTMLHQQN